MVSDVGASPAARALCGGFKRSLALQTWVWRWGRAFLSLSLGGSIYDPTDAVGKLLFNVLAMVAEFSVISTRRSGDVPRVGTAA